MTRQARAHYVRLLQLLYFKAMAILSPRMYIVSGAKLIFIVSVTLNCIVLFVE